MTLNELYNLAETEDIDVMYFPMTSVVSVSLPSGDIAIDVDKLENSIEEKICLAHEIGHCVTGSFYNINSELDVRKKHEIRANRWAIRALIDKQELLNALKGGITNTWDLADYFDVSEVFIKEAVQYYNIA